MRRSVIGSPGLLLASLHDAHLQYSERCGPKRVMGWPNFTMLRFPPKKLGNGEKGEMVIRLRTYLVYRQYSNHDSGGFSESPRVLGLAFSVLPQHPSSPKH